MARVLWIDASAGVAGDMLLGALVDLGVPIEALQAAVDAVLPGATRLVGSTVSRAGLRATKVDVQIAPSPAPDADVNDPRADHRPPSRTWAGIRSLLGAADLPPAVREPALRTFARLAEAEGRVHGLPADAVHFHEVGAVDAVADIVGSCAGFAALDLAEVVLSPVAVGAGEVRTDHGRLPVPTPAVLELAAGWDVLAGADPLPEPSGGRSSGGGAGELATPTGLALVTTHARRSGPLPEMRVLGTGVGAGSRDRPGRANVVRLVLGTTEHEGTGKGGRRHGDDVAPDEPAVDEEADHAVVLETNVDDLDPRVWPDVLARLLGAGALDTWLTPIHAKKGRPGHVLHVLARAQDELALADLVLTHTSTLGLRVTPVRRHVLERSWRPVGVLGGQVRVKLGFRDGRLVQVMPEFDEVADLAHGSGLPLAQVLVLARSAAAGAGLVPGAAWPPLETDRGDGAPDEDRGPIQSPS